MQSFSEQNRSTTCIFCQDQPETSVTWQPSRIEIKRSWPHWKIASVYYEKRLNESRAKIFYIVLRFRVFSFFLGTTVAKLSRFSSRGTILQYGKLASLSTVFFLPSFRLGARCKSYFFGCGWINWNIVSDVYILTKRKKSINAERNENVELTHTQVFCGRLCVLCE